MRSGLQDIQRAEHRWFQTPGRPPGSGDAAEIVAFLGEAAGRLWPMGASSSIGRDSKIGPDASARDFRMSDLREMKPGDERDDGKNGQGKHRPGNISDDNILIISHERERPRCRLSMKGTRDRAKKTQLGNTALRST